MKKYSFKYIFFALLLLGASSCKEYLDVNLNPTVPTKVGAHLLLPSIIQNMARGIQFDSRGLSRYTQNWVTTAAGDNWERHGYTVNSDFGGEIWRQHYWAIGKNVDLMIEDAQANNRNIYIGIAHAVRAWSWQTLTDVHGDVILKQAYNQDLVSFDFDKQQDVFAQVRLHCDSALYYLGLPSAADPNLANADQFYKGDASKWRKFVYGVLARNYARLTNKTSGTWAYKPDSVIAFCDRALATSADDANVPFAGTVADDANFYGVLRNNVGAYRPARFVVGLMDSSNIVFNGARDPRLPVMMGASTDGVVRGYTPIGGEASSTPTAQRAVSLWGFITGQTASGKGRFMFQDNARLPIMTSFEMQFIKAEAQLRKGDKAGALVSYRKGIEGHLDFCNYFGSITTPALSVSAANRTAFLANTSVVPTVADSLNMARLMCQKYIADWGWNHVETWNDLRRYHYEDSYQNIRVYPNFYRPTTTQWFPDNGGEKWAYRVRPRYNSEYVWNLEKLKVIGADKIDYHTVETWFSKPE